MSATRLRMDATVALPAGLVARSASTHDLRGSSFSFGLAAVPGGTSGVARLRLYPSGGDPTVNALTLGWEGGQLAAGMLVNGADPGRVAAGYVASSMRYLRVREGAGTVVLERSPDGVAWTEVRSGSVPWPIDVLRVEYQAGGAVGVAEFDDVTSTPPLRNRGTSAASGGSPLTAGFASGVAAGRLLLTALLGDKSLGTITPPWRQLAPPHSGTSVSGGLAARIGANSAENATWTWTGANGAQVITVETGAVVDSLDGVVGTTATNGEAPTSGAVTADLGAAPGEGILVAAYGIDTAPTDGHPWPQNMVPLHTVYNIPGADVAGGAGGSVAARRVRAGEATRLTADWGVTDQAFLCLAFVPAAGSRVLTPFVPVTPSANSTSAPTLLNGRLYYDSGNSQWSRQDWGSVGDTTQQEVAVKVHWDRLDATSSRWAGVAFASTDVPFHDGSAGSTPPADSEAGSGYRVGLRQNGGMILGSFTNGVFDYRVAEDLPAGALPAVTAGLVETVRFGRRPDLLPNGAANPDAGKVYATRSRADGTSVTMQSAAADRKHKGVWWNLGKFGNDGINVSFSEATVTI